MIAARNEVERPMGSNLRDAVIDFSRSVPPPSFLFADGLKDTLASLSQQFGTGELALANIPGGRVEDRMAASQWLRHRFAGAIDPQRVIITNGTQVSLLSLLLRIVKPGSVLAAERLTYSVLTSLAEQARVQIQPVSIDEYGLEPNSFEQTCRSYRVSALYLNPTVHNPTAAMMPSERRLQIIEIARKYDVTIFEDDVLGLACQNAPSPIGALAPEMTWYMMGLTKCLGDGLRIGFLVAPTMEEAEQFMNDMARLSFWFPSLLSSAIVTGWINHGFADRLLHGGHRQAVERSNLAAKLLRRFDCAILEGAPHIWWRLPEEWSQLRFTEAAAQENVLIRPANLFAVGNEEIPRAVRLSLNSPPSPDDVQTGLQRLVQIISRS